MLHTRWLMLHAIWLMVHGVWLMLHALPPCAGFCCTLVDFVARIKKADNHVGLRVLGFYG